MKISRLLKVYSFISVLAFIGIIKASCQDSYIKGRWNFKLGYARYVTGTETNNKEDKTGNIRLETNYGVLKNVEAGLYLGYSKFPLWGQLSGYKDCATPFYGININFHMLPFFINANDFRFDLYLTGNYGGRYIISPSDFYWRGHYNEYGAGGGLTFYLWKHIGLYLEYTYGKYHFKEAGEFTIKDNTKLRYGVSLKF